MPQLPQWSGGEHCAEDPTGGSSGIKRQKQAKNAAQTVSKLARKMLIYNDFRLACTLLTNMPYGAHNPKVVGSNPAPATKKYQVL